MEDASTQDARMDGTDALLANNRAWAASVVGDTPELFATLARGQSPAHLWIGCSDSRVPADEVVGLGPGGLFVHRNIANLVVDGDCNSLSVLQYAVDALRVGHVIVVGHYGCGGVKAALGGPLAGPLGGAVDGPLAEWIAPIRVLAGEHAAELSKLAPDARHARLCELNAVAQAANVARTSIVSDAWARGQALAVHAWIYDLGTGLLRDLGPTVTRPA